MASSEHMGPRTGTPPSGITLPPSEHMGTSAAGPHTRTPPHGTMLPSPKGAVALRHCPASLGARKGPPSLSASPVSCYFVGPLRPPLRNHTAGREPLPPEPPVARSPADRSPAVQSPAARNPAT
ncbi:hypothetical protein GUJ93_ZPchr0010g10407 [Zizania palustris]|uniref:Uncharacterized protein n=1 Tax=Zizania palustris TaxID=103762 RepID=A0A8J5T9L7_ZIZPA|nr:hypothetical protein GUJ93_ZPchr0010g10407 [Zizania palustris]